MQKTIPAYSFELKSYYLLTKPGILMGNGITAAAGFCLASQGAFDLWLFLAAVLGLSLTIASSCVFNNYIDRKADQKMARTQNRGLATGRVSVFYALAIAFILGILGIAVLALFTNFLAVAAALFGFLTYVLLYSFSKYYSVHGTVVGSFAGAIPPVVGYTAASGSLDWGSAILFSMVVLWQMPHFYAIAIYRMKEYEAASIPVLPLVKGIRSTKVQMFAYTALFVLASLPLYFLGYAGTLYLSTLVILGMYWLSLCWRGFYVQNDQFWARQVFRFSLVLITVISIVIITENMY